MRLSADHITCDVPVYVVSPTCAQPSRAFTYLEHARAHADINGDEGFCAVVMAIGGRLPDGREYDAKLDAVDAAGGWREPAPTVRYSVRPNRRSRHDPGLAAVIDAAITAITAITDHYLQGRHHDTGGIRAAG